MSTGRYGEVFLVKAPWIPEYQVLVFPDCQGPPTSTERAELAVIAIGVAQAASLARYGDAECYLLIHNGLGVRRSRDFHFHIAILSGRWQKAVLYGWLFAKNLLHPVWLLTRRLRRKHMRRREDEVAE
ncbi:hypothetical protein [Tahibacter amnicola]|uniref:Uncharacterized protein n=1 Tax=Tahibacter amnicola TaxID=2976241 RepID=A0ABY6BEM7_9GAMM|nr:hypothetical protein [Tahibacter amnicola]UXI68237.1 hypothetical protein N4264_00865 [Tahibacter amnicola]